ncbi:MAG: DUF2007 domain-containing protein [Planctomycetes bacterium]|nr:DUF2007 domain-containing protein [Planctomycetota bacterium]
MSKPISTVVKIASTPDQAKIYVAMLEAAGIPAFIDGNSSVDEFAMSQRLLNVSNVKVMVPTDAADRAREVLSETVVDADELARQAMESKDDPEAERES